jgi:DNA-binding NtrC family response regulator
LAQHFLGKYASEAGKASTRSLRSHRLAVPIQLAGNVRELEHVIERAVALTADPIILIEDLPTKLQEPAQTSTSSHRLMRWRSDTSNWPSKNRGQPSPGRHPPGVIAIPCRMAKRHGLISDNVHE